MRTTRSPESPSLAPPGRSVPVHGADREPEAPPRAPVPHARDATRAMRLLHRSAAAPSGFMSAEERAYVEHRRSGCD